MNGEPWDTLSDAGLDPTPRFQADLEATLMAALRDERTAELRATSISSRRYGSRRWIAMGGVASVALIAGVILIVHDKPPTTTVVDAPTDSSDPDQPIIPSPPTSPEVLTPTPSTLLPSTTVNSEVSDSAATMSPTTVAVPVTSMPPSGLSVLIDLGQRATPLAPVLIASIPGDDRLVLAPVADDRVAVLDVAGSTISFLDAVSGTQTSSFPIAMPTTLQVGEFFVGPNDVIYVPDFTGQLSQMVAYGPSDQAYVEFARVNAQISDDALVLGESGITTLASPAPPPLMAYVGLDGQPSGSTLSVAPVSRSAVGTAVVLQRGTHNWSVTYQGNSCVDQNGASFCTNVEYGPSDSIVLVDQTSTNGVTTNRVTLLADTSISWDTDWTYVGAVGNRMLFSRISRNVTEISIVDVSTLAAP